MPEKIKQKVFHSLPYIGVLFMILFLTTLIPALYFQSESDMEISFWFVRAFLIAITPILFIPAIYWISIKRPILQNWKNILLHVVLSAVFCFFFLLIFQLTLFYLYQGKNFLALALESITNILTRQFFSVGTILFFGYWGIVVLFGLKRYYEDVDDVQRKANEIQSQLEQATLSSLQAQLKPHFLFNTLSMVDQMLTENPSQAVSMVDKLERLLRNTFDRNNSESCTIEEEVEFLKKYLSIEENRFQDRLTVEYSISDSTENIMIPRYLLQPLVENAIVHGVGKTIQKSVILIKSELLADQLVLSVENNVSSFRSFRRERSKGIGLNNVEKRIHIYFGEDARLNVSSSKADVFKSRILIPKKYLLDQQTEKAKDRSSKSQYHKSLKL